MLNQDYYVREKLRELEREQLTRLSLRATAGPHRAPVISPVVRGTGRLLRRLGEGLESWGGHESEPPMQLERKPR
jgi:hypothetical protein